MYENLPQELKVISNWVGWKFEVRDGTKTKIPYDIQTGRKAHADDPKTWTTFERASLAVDNILGDSGYSGLGFELGNTNLAGIDFDNAVDHKGVIDPYILAIIGVLGNPYTERSPSGKGLHVFVDCDSLPAGKRKLSKNHDGVEIYRPGPTFEEGGRYFTCTGERVLGNGVPKIADMALPYLLITQNKDKKFKSLWLGDTSAFDGDDSSADFALLVKLAALTANDAAKMEEYFGLSKLGQREKWTNRGDYRERSVNSAIDRLIQGAIETNRTGKYELPPEPLRFKQDPVADPNGEYVIAPVDGQMDGWFPLGDISLIGGASGTGKTTFIFEMLKKQKHGDDVLGHRTRRLAFHVLAYDRGKNAFERTMQRLGLNLTEIPTTPLPLAFGTNAVQNIIVEIEKLPSRPQVIFLEGLDMLIDDANKKSIVSPFMKQLQEVAAHFHIALIGSLGAPKTKRGEDYAAKRDHLSGSEAWGRNCETVAIIEFSEEDDGTAPRRELTILPRNAPAEKFSLEFQQGKLVQVAAQTEEEKRFDNKTGRPRTAIDAAIQFLQEQLQRGPKSGHDIQEAAKLQGISLSTLSRACGELRVDTNGPRRHGSHEWSMCVLEKDICV